MDRRATYPGERMIVLAEQRREWRAGLSAMVVVLGATIGSWLALSAPPDPSRLNLIPAAEAASLFAEQPGTLHRLNRAGPVQEAQATTTPEQQPGGTGEPMQTSAPLTHDDLVRVQARLKALGYDPGTADGRADQRTLEALNEYRKSLGLQPTQSVDRQAVAPLTP
ncbi:peptidoglycan-binding domain-containing protein [Dongia sedimenti]|uniref:Peptidoglycan-binding domain-containing protein n=1 Tax=Dongia sedimenti TaxID=3064282 RepID=A0ABU0YLX8_9PROT|nr:peptidoglycan-binding domain-containing protein [Rhodospirillaceae bacterium R-7]